MQAPLMIEASRGARTTRRLTRRCSEPARHKVLGRGRPSAESTRALERPRAEASRPVAELGS